MSVYLTSYTSAVLLFAALGPLNATKSTDHAVCLRPVMTAVYKIAIS